MEGKLKMLNPIFAREIKTTLRSFKLIAAIMAYLITLLVFAGLFLYSSMNSYYYSFNPQDTLTLYFLLSTFQIFLIMIIIPTSAGAAISGERERQTLELILVSKMSTFSIVFGKFLASLSIVFLLIISSLPVFGIIFYYGVVSLSSLIHLILFTFFLSCLAGSISIFFSTVLKKTILSIIIVYLVMIVASVLPLIAIVLMRVGHDKLMSNSTAYVAPFVANYFLVAISPLTAFLTMIGDQFTNMNPLNSVLGYGAQLPQGKIAIWKFSMIIYAVLTVFFMTLSAKFIKPVGSKKQKVAK